MDVAVSEPLHRIDNAARRFVINVITSAAQDYEVRSCEITSDAFRNRTSFQNRVSLDDVFTEEIAAGLRSCLDKLTGETEVSPCLILFLKFQVLRWPAHRWWLRKRRTT